MFIIYFVVELLHKVMIDLFFHIAHGELLVGILADFGNPCAAGFDVVLTDVQDGILVEFLQLVLVENELIAPCPAIVAVVVVDFVKAAEHLLNVVDVSFDNVGSKPFFLAFRQQKT